MSSVKSSQIDLLATIPALHKRKERGSEREREKQRMRSRERERENRRRSIFLDKMLL